MPLCVSSLSSTKLTKLYCTSIAVDNVNEINLIKGATSLLTTAINLIKGTTLIAFTLCIGLYVYRRDPFRCQTKGKLRRRAQTQQRAQTPPRRKKKKKLGTPSNLYTSRQLFTATVGQDQDQDQYDDRLIPDERTLKSPGKFSTCKSVQYWVESVLHSSWLNSFLFCFYFELCHMQTPRRRVECQCVLPINRWPTTAIRHQYLVHTTPWGTGTCTGTPARDKPRHNHNHMHSSTAVFTRNTQYLGGTCKILKIIF